MEKSFDVFLSHTSQDRPAVRKIAEALIATGLKVWLDEWNIVPGQSWQVAIEDAIIQSKAVLIVISKSGVGPWQDMEINVALQYTVEQRRPVIPVLLPDVQQTKLPVFISQISSISIKSWKDEDFQDALSKIIWGITGKLKVAPKLKPIPKVFLCHAKEDDPIVRNLYFRLRDYNIDAWYDKEKLVVGDRWEQEIIEAIENTDFFAMCLSRKAINKTGFIQREIKLAVKEYQKRPQQMAFLLPVRLEACEVPNIKLDDVTTLSDFQWIDLFEEEEESLQQFASGVKKQFEKILRNST